MPLAEGIWYSLRCRLDGTSVRAWLDGANELVGTWSGSFPVRFGLECQRSGGRFRNPLLRRP